MTIFLNNFRPFRQHGVFECTASEIGGGRYAFLFNGREFVLLYYFKCRGGGGFFMIFCFFFVYVCVLCLCVSEYVCKISSLFSYYHS